jgi:thiol:disulfide interchange protein DsbA
MRIFFGPLLVTFCVLLLVVAVPSKKIVALSFDDTNQVVVAHAMSIAQVYEEGVHYEIIDAEATNEPEVREFFSFFCSHCYNYEGLVKLVKPDLKSDVFVRSHVDGLGLSTKIDQARLTRTLVVLQQMPAEIREKGVATIFDVIHRQKSGFALVTDDSMHQLLISTGMEKATVIRMWDSNETEVAFKAMSLLQQDLFDRNQLVGVPSVVVNGRYLVTHKGLNKKDVPNDYLGLLNHLLAK